MSVTGTVKNKNDLLFLPKELREKAKFGVEVNNSDNLAIQCVAIDISAAYVKGVCDNFGNAQVVYDKFHVIQNFMEACDQVRKAESRSNAGKRDLLERTRWMWLKNRVNWTEKEAQKWQSMALERCVTGMASR